MDKCEFEKKGYCTALICYSSEKYNARNENDNPKYATNKEKERIEGIFKKYSRSRIFLDNIEKNIISEDFENVINEIIGDDNK